MRSCENKSSTIYHLPSLISSLISHFSLISLISIFIIFFQSLPNFIWYSIKERDEMVDEIVDHEMVDDEMVIVDEMKWLKYFFSFFLSSSTKASHDQPSHHQPSHLSPTISSSTNSSHLSPCLYKSFFCDWMN